MRPAVITQLRNEIAILPAFLPHLAALFDVAVLLDHGSIDGTAEALREAAGQRPGWQYWNVAVPGHHQALFAAFALRHIFTNTDADTVIFLDADEFLDVPDAAALHAALARLDTPRAVGMFHWTNCLPASLVEETVRPGDALWCAGSTSHFGKVAITRALFDATGGRATPSSGNHSVVTGDCGGVDERPIGRILHLPLRSVAQMRRKMLTGALSVLARGDNAANESTHWFAGLRDVANPRLGDKDAEAALIAMAADYGVPPAQTGPRTLEALAAHRFQPRLLDVATAPLTLATPISVLDTDRVVAAVLADWRQQCSAALTLFLDGTTLRALQHAPAMSGALPNEAEHRVCAEAERDAARLEIAMLRNSTSWRITAPLRALGRLLRGVPPQAPPHGF